MAPWYSAQVPGIIPKSNSQMFEGWLLCVTSTIPSSAGQYRPDCGVNKIDSERITNAHKQNKKTYSCTQALPHIHTVAAFPGPSSLIGLPVTRMMWSLPLVIRPVSSSPHTLLSPSATTRPLLPHCFNFHSMVANSWELKIHSLEAETAVWHEAELTKALQNTHGTIPNLVSMTTKIIHKP